MKFGSFLRPSIIWLAAACFLLPLTGAAGQVGELKFEAFLVWATNSEKPADRDYKPVPEDVRKKLDELPLKWANYFEVNRRNLAVSEKQSGSVVLSAKCEITVKDLDGKNVEVSLIGKGKPVLKRIQPLPAGEMLVLGGNAPDSTGWLVVLKRLH